MLFRCCCVVLLVTHMTSLSLLLTYCVMIVGDCCGSQGETTFKTDAHLIRGCQSQVWLTYESSDEGLKFTMDSDAHIVRGLIAVVLIVIQNRSAREIQRLDIEEIFSQLDLLAHLSVTRGNGLRAMVSRVKEVARGYAT